MALQGRAARGTALEGDRKAVGLVPIPYLHPDFCLERVGREIGTGYEAYTVEPVDSEVNFVSGPYFTEF